MVSGDGWYILPPFRDHINPIQDYSSVQWPTQGLPSETAWGLWQRMINKCFPSGTDGRLCDPLGNWIDVDKEWGSFFDKSTRSCYVRSNQKWYRFVLNKETFDGHNQRYVFIDHEQPHLPISHIAVAWITNNVLHTHGLGLYRPLSHPQQSEWYFKCIDNISHTERQQIAEAIRNRKAIALTNGSYKQYGSAGYCLGASFSTLWRGACRVPGHHTIQGSYRSELMGIYATLKLCQKVCELYNITTGGITLACDNLGAGRKACQTSSYPSTKWDHFDLIQAIYRLRQQLPITVRYLHVKGHQRTKRPLQPMDEWALLNESMDGLAKAYLTYSASSAPISDIIDEHEWYVKAKGRKISVKAKKQLNIC